MSKNIFTGVLAIIGSIFLILFSMIFTGNANQDPSPDAQNIWYTVQIQKGGTDDASIEQTLLNKQTQKLKINTPVIANFGRLVSYLYISPEGIQKKELVQSGTTDVTVNADAGIVSLYDLFAHYSIHSDRGSFRLDQITNGSFYVGYEPDGKVSIYSIDGVARLTFLDKGAEMTNMVLFPGSYIHFDPKRNASLKDADLFRIITTLDVTNNEVFEFVNPRVNIGDDKDTFFNYRLPPEAKTLFQILSLSFKSRVDNINTLKDYGQKISYTASDDELRGVKNPTKINHQMLLELSGLLSQVVNPDANLNDLVVKIGNIYNTAKGMKVEGPSAKKTIEQFLLDGRFALYGGATNARYQDIYEAIAKMIGIQNDGGNSKLFQNLSNIYSQNLFNQKKTGAVNTIKIDTYGQTAAELKRTLSQGGVNQKDYFDIAIYAYNILNKAEISPELLSLDTVSDSVTYDLLTTFLYATKKYVDSVSDSDLQKRTVSGFSSQFYDHILTTVSNSLYKNFVVSSSGSLFLQSDYIKGIAVHTPDGLFQNISGLNIILDDVAPTIQNVFLQTNATSDVGIRIKKALLRIKGFQNLINPDTYKDYVNAPYKADVKESIPLPLLDPALDSLVSLSPGDIQTEANSGDISLDSRIQTIGTLFPNIDKNTLVRTGSLIKITNVPLQISRDNKDPSTINMSLDMENQDSLKNINFTYNGNVVAVSIDSMSVPVYTNFLTQIQYYLNSIDSNNVSLATVENPIRILPIQRRISIGGNLYAINIP